MESLPEYLEVRGCEGEGLTVRVDLGTAPTEAGARLEEARRLVGARGGVSLLEVDGPCSLDWGHYIRELADLLLAKQVEYIAIPERKVAGVKGQLGVYVMEKLQDHLTTAPLTFIPETTPLRDVINVSPVTSRVLGLTEWAQEEDSTLKSINQSFISYQENKLVPAALRRHICNLYKLVKKNNRADKKRLQALKNSSKESASANNDDCSSGTDDTNDEEDYLSDNTPNCSKEEKHKESTENTLTKMKKEPTPSGSKYNMKVKPPLIKKKCYVCRTRNPVPAELTEAIKQYPRLCQTCADLNWEMRHRRVDLTGYYALVTGGRVKIGYIIVLRLLRAGCHVITTSRFPHDTAKRYSQEQDYSAWCHRLQIYPLELKDYRGIYTFIEHVKQTIPHLDILINNAAQTLHRPYSFYEHLLEYERLAPDTLTAPQHALLPAPARLTYTNASNCLMAKDQGSASHVAVGGGMTPTGKRPCPFPALSDGASQKKAKLDTVAGAPDTPCGALLVAQDFPVGCRDEFGQQLDLRQTNSWRTTLEEVQLTELVEVMMINTIAPYILCKELKDLMLISPHQRRFIVNVSAMEGQFNRDSKTRYHPHTNMAKAALNMMTRTGALGYYDDHIYMTSVDTGWVTDERPFAQAAHEAEQGFILPLDCEDGAARVIHPILHGVDNKEEPYYAVFLKNYSPYPW